MFDVFLFGFIAIVFFISIIKMFGARINYDSGESKDKIIEHRNNNSVEFNEVFNDLPSTTNSFNDSPSDSSPNNHFYDPTYSGYIGNMYYRHD